VLDDRAEEESKNQVCSVHDPDARCAKHGVY
jgi:hypothetical protein